MLAWVTNTLELGVEVREAPGGAAEEAPGGEVVV